MNVACICRLLNLCCQAFLQSEQVYVHLVSLQHKLNDGVAQSHYVLLAAHTPVLVLQKAVEKCYLMGFPPV